MMQKAIHDCETGETVLVDMTPAEEAALAAEWGPAVIPPTPLEELIAIKLKLEWLENNQQALQSEIATVALPKGEVL